MKRIIAVFLCAVFALTLVACNGASNGGDETSPVVHQAPIGTEAGKSCPDLTFQSRYGDKTVSVWGNRGAVTVINFWFTTCPYCIIEMPYFYEAAAEYGDKVEIVLLHADTGADVKGWIEQNQPELADGTLTVSYDAVGYNQKQFSVQYFPTTVIIDTEGVIQTVRVGMMSKELLTSEIDKALK